MKRMVKIKFEEKGKVFFDSAVIGKDITEEQAQGLVEQGIAQIIEIPNNKSKKESEEK